MLYLRRQGRTPSEHSRYYQIFMQWRFPGCFDLSQPRSWTFISFWWTRKGSAYPLRHSSPTDGSSRNNPLDLWCYLQTVFGARAVLQTQLEKLPHKPYCPTPRQGYRNKMWCQSRQKTPPKLAMLTVIHRMSQIEVLWTARPAPPTRAP